MSEKSKAVIVWRGDFGRPPNHYAQTVVKKVTNWAAMTTLTTALQAYSDCNCVSGAWQEIWPQTDALPGVDANVDRRATIYMRNPTTLGVCSITIPAPATSIVEGTAEGERVTDAACAAIVALINTATGESYAALYGIVTQKR